MCCMSQCVLSLVVHSARSASDFFVCCLPFFWSGCDLVIVAGCFHPLLVDMLLLGLACYFRRFGASVALLSVRDERCARRGVADETLPTARATQCWCLAVGQLNRKTGNTLPCEGGSFTDLSTLVCSTSLGSHFFVHIGNSSCVVVSCLACCFGLRFARARYRAVREADAKSWLLDWNGRVALEVDRILPW